MSEREKLEQAIIAQENLRGTVDDSIIEATVAVLKQQLEQLAATGRPEQRKLVTALFMDTVGSTEMIRDLDPEDDLALMDTAMQRLSEPVIQHGGRVTRYMGDGFKAVFGIPAAHENDPIMAVRAGLGILAEAEAYAREVEEKWAIRCFDVRVGINTGLVVIGGQSEGSDTTTGKAINLAARLESSADPGTLFISYDTYRLVRGLFDLEAKDPIKVKGFPEPVAVYRVLRAKERSFRSRRRGVEGIDTRMVGREEELKILQDAYHAVLAGDGLRIVTIVGDAGLGKSRLLYEFEHWVDLQPAGVLLYRGRARLETQRLPYGLLRDMFAFRFAIKDDDTAETVREKVMAGFIEMLGHGEKTEMKAHFVGHLLGYNFRGSPYVEGVKSDPQQIHNRALGYLADYFRAASSQDPVLILFEDLHWAGDSSLEAITSAGGILGGLPILIVGAARPGLIERRPLWFERRDLHSRLDLHSLSKQDSHRLLEEVLQKVEQVPEAVRELVVSHAEGNPFYVEEMVKMLIEEGVFVKGEESWQVQMDRLSAVHVPSTLTGVLQARLDSLAEEERSVLQQAAVVGRVFWDAAVVHVNRNGDGELADDSILPRLDALRERELVYRNDMSAFSGAVEYIFKHAVLRQVTYESVLKRLRRVYHALIADWLIAHSGERAGEVTGLIAGHLELAGDDDRAAGYLRRAGEQAVAQFANKEAAGYFSRALALTPAENLDERLALLLAREFIFGEQGEREAQALDLAESERLVVKLDEAERVPAQVEIALRRAKYAEATSDFPAAVAAAIITVDLANSVGDVQYEAAGYLHWGRALWKQANYEEARVQLQQALTLARSVEARAEEAGSLLNLGNIRAFQGEYAQAQAYYLEALPIYRKSGHRNGEGSVLGNLGNTYGYLGHAEQAIYYYEQALAIAREIGDRHNEGTWLGNLAVDYKSLGQLERALDYGHQALTIARQIGDRRNQVMWFNILGTAYYILGQMPKAIESHQAALDMARELGSRWGESRALIYLGINATSQEVYDEAQSYFHQSLAAGRDVDDQEGEAFALHGMGDAWLGLGHLDEAAAAFQRAIDLYQELGLSHMATESHAGLARVRLREGKPALALVHGEAILDFLSANSLEGIYEPFRVYLTCYQVLQANQDPRAPEILTAAHEMLHKWAARIADKERHRSFLQNVSSHREIVAEFARISDRSADPGAL
jgi:class 3 adenylate cyclase/tetratricopeptide (TPR) repeat protein